MSHQETGRCNDCGHDLAAHDGQWWNPCRLCEDAGLLCPIGVGEFKTLPTPLRRL